MECISWWMYYGVAIGLNQIISWTTKKYNFRNPLELNAKFFEKQIKKSTFFKWRSKNYL